MEETCEECQGRGAQCTVCESYYTDKLGCEDCGAPEDKFKPCRCCGGSGVIETD